MSVYHQMGYQSEILLEESALQGYAGAILSPVNSDLQLMIKTAAKYKSKGNHEIIFDPQMYYPRTEDEKLRLWSYFPSDFATVDASSENWWNPVISNLISVVSEIKATAVCSPVYVPKVYSNGYFAAMTNVAENLYKQAQPLGIDVLQTLLVSLSELSTVDRVFAIASIITRTSLKRAYLVLVDETEPRREIIDVEELKGVMNLISILEGAGIQTLIGFCSSDVVLWKAAGASSCATGKFWLLRRFTPTRWNPDEVEDRGKGALPYLLEESLLASIRESDISRVTKYDMISDVTKNNPYYADIINKSSNGIPWIGVGWRQYLYWFYDIESRISRKEIDVASLLKTVEQNWVLLGEKNVLMEEPYNDGPWLRPWRRALAEFRQM